MWIWSDWTLVDEQIRVVLGDHDQVSCYPRPFHQSRFSQLLTRNSLLDNFGNHPIISMTVLWTQSGVNFSITISTLGILTNFSQEVHNWNIWETTISVMQIRVKFLLFHDFWYFFDFPRLSMTTNFPPTFPDIKWLWEPCYFLLQWVPQLFEHKQFFPCKQVMQNWVLW